MSAVDDKDTYDCPVYATAVRFRQEVFTVALKTRQPWAKWAKAGVCLLLEAAEGG